jgi:hypothetical protein
VRLFAVVDGDLAGWLGELAPRGDLNSTQLLYRMCCLYKPPEHKLLVLPSSATLDIEGEADNMYILHTRLIPLLMLAYQTVPPQPLVSTGPQPVCSLNL